MFLSKFKEPKIPIILNYTNLHFKIAMTQLKGFGSIRVRRILEKSPNIESFFRMNSKDLTHEFGFSLDQAKLLDRSSALEQAKIIVDKLSHQDFNIHFYTDENYPKRLRNCPDPPIVFYSKGHLNLNPQRTVAIVGTRNATDYGKQLCYDLIQTFKGQDIQVVSGLAYGIDIEVHKACLENDIETVGVLACSLDRVYPSVHQSIAKEMLHHGGLISEYPPFTQPDRENFPMRNRIVAGMTDATIVVESKKRGGSLITANLASDYDRDVFAFPGSIYQEYSKGCNLMIQRNKAIMLDTTDRFLDEMQWRTKVDKKEVQQKLDFNLNDDEQSIYNLLKHHSQLHIDQLSTKLKMMISKVNVGLLSLEIYGLVKSMPGKQYAIK